MKHIKSIAFGLLLTCQLIYSATAFSAQGTVILRDKDNVICTLPVPEPGKTIQYSFDYYEGVPKCKNWDHRARWIQLAEVPSATTISLYETYNCVEFNSFIILKTRKKQTNSSNIEIQYLTTYEDNQIIEPGLQMIKMHAIGQFIDEVSCISITTSRTPPSP